MRTFRNMHAPTSKTSNHRARWAAIGAAVAVSLGAGGLGIVSAVAPEGASAYIPITPCRLVDTRAGSGQVGAQVGPIPADTAITVDGWGDVAGDCNLPGDSTGLQLNVTAVNGTQASFLTLYPQGGTRPTASNVNFTGASPTPNSATVTLNATNGQFHVYNRFGTVDVVIDVAGYFAGHQHDGADIIDETITGADLDNGTVMDIDTGNEAGIAYNSETDPNTLAAADEFVVRTQINVPSDGYVVALAELQWENGSTGMDRGRCQLTKGDDVSIATAEPYLRLTDGGDPEDGLFYSDTHQRVFEVAAADDTGDIISGFGQYINLVCDQTDGVVQIEYATLTLQFFPTDYTTGGFVFLGCPPFCIIQLEEEGL